MFSFYKFSAEMEKNPKYNRTDPLKKEINGKMVNLDRLVSDMYFLSEVDRCVRA